MRKITDINEAIKYLREMVNVNVEDISDLKYNIWDEDMNFYCDSDKTLIDYANEQKEAIEDDDN